MGLGFKSMEKKKKLRLRNGGNPENSPEVRPKLPKL